jgi:hypothetical protein
MPEFAANQRELVIDGRTRRVSGSAVMRGHVLLQPLLAIIDVSTRVLIALIC